MSGGSSAAPEVRIYRRKGMQRYPAYVFSLGHAEFAVDEQMAKNVRVHPLNG